MTPDRGGWTAADELLATLQGRQLAGEATDYLAGRAWVTIWHGDPETPDDARLITALAEHVDGLQRQWPGCVRLRQSGNDYTAMQFAPVPGAPAPEALTEQLAAFASDLAPRLPALGGRTWWRITRTAPSGGPPGPD